MQIQWQADREGQLSSFLKGELKMSSGLMNKLKWGEGLQVNGIPRRTNYPVKPGDRITVCLDEEKPEFPPEQGPLQILYEDSWLLAVDKPAGMLIHPSRSRNTGTLANLVAGYYEKTSQSCAFHPLTRLDRDTFGVVLLGKNAYIHTLLQQAPVEKIYHALTLGVPEPAAGSVDLPIGRKPLPSLLREISPGGKPSLTEYETLDQHSGIAMLSLRPVTGRTHQLRVHCAAIGCPILGDPQYGSPEAHEQFQKMGLESQLLCAKSLRLPHPISGEELLLCSRMDVSLEALQGSKA